VLLAVFGSGVLDVAVAVSQIPWCGNRNPTRIAIMTVIEAPLGSELVVHVTVPGEPAWGVEQDTLDGNGPHHPSPLPGLGTLPTHQNVVGGSGIPEGVLSVARTLEAGSRPLLVTMIVKPM
jgi:hypothetical protein